MSEASPFQGLQQLLEDYPTMRRACLAPDCDLRKHYRVQVEEFKTLGLGLTPHECERSFLRIVGSHECLTKPAKASLPLRFEISEDLPLPDNARDLRIAQKSGEGDFCQSSVGGTGRKGSSTHCESKAHVARQEALIAKLSSDHRYAAVLAEAGAGTLDDLKELLALVQADQASAALSELKSGGKVRGQAGLRHQ